MGLLAEKSRRPVARPWRASLRLRTLTLEPLEPRRLLAGPQIEGLDPAAGSHTAPLDTDVTAVFDQAIAPASVSDATFAVHAMQFGKLLQPDNALTVDGDTVALNPAADFQPGEFVQATATTGIQNLSGQGSPAPYVWQFRTQVPGGNGYFSDSGQDLYNSGTYTVAVATGDLDKDGDVDAFSANGGGPDKVWLNDGRGHFEDSGQALGNSDSFAVALGDLDGDGHLDAFVGNYLAFDRVWMNDGQGRFLDSGQELGGKYTHSVALGDVDGDGDLDAFLGNTGPNTVWLNDGQGNFFDSGQGLAESPTRAVALGDLDGDGDLDAFAGNAKHGVAADRIWVNNGNGVFNPSGQDLSPQNTSSVSLGDLDSDGDLDALVGIDGGPNQVWLNRGPGCFREASQLTGELSTRDVALGDLDADGDLDAFVANAAEGGRHNEVWLNRGLGHFSNTAQTLGSFYSRTAALADLDADGDLDAFVGNPIANKVWLNRGGLFDLSISTTDGRVTAEPGETLTYTVTVTNQGPIDTVGATVTNVFPSSLTGVTWTAVGSPGSVFSPSGVGEIHETIDLPVGGTITYTATGTVDPNATGTLSNRATVEAPAGIVDQTPENDTAVDVNTLTLAATAGNGIFSDSGQNLGISLAVAVGDLDGDGDLDAFLGGGEVSNTLLLNDGQGHFSDSKQHPGSRSTDAAALGDIDGDGDLDIVIDTGEPYTPSNEVWLNDGQGVFHDSGQRLGSADIESLALGDIDGDGDLDIVFHNVWRNDGQGQFTDTGQVLLSGQAADAEGVELGDLDGDGDLDVFLALRGANEVWLNDGRGRFVDSGQRLGFTTSRGVSLGDLDGDGDLDAFVSNRGLFPSDDPANTVWFNDGRGFFRDSAQRLGNTRSEDVKLGDLDADGDLDAFVANYAHVPGGGSKAWFTDPLSESSRSVR